MCNPSVIWISQKKSTWPSGKLRTKITSPIAKSTSPRQSDMTFFARCLPIIVNILRSGYFKQDASNKRELQYCTIVISQFLLSKIPLVWVFPTAHMRRVILLEPCHNWCLLDKWEHLVLAQLCTSQQPWKEPLQIYNTQNVQVTSHNQGMSDLTNWHL